MLDKSAQPFNRWLGHLEREMRLAESCPGVPHRHGLHLPICLGSAADSWQGARVQLERPTTSKQLSLLLSVHYGAFLIILPSIFTASMRSYFFSHLANAHFYHFYFPGIRE